MSRETRFSVGNGLAVSGLTTAIANPEVGLSVALIGAFISATNYIPPSAGQNLKATAASYLLGATVILGTANFMNEEAPASSQTTQTEISHQKNIIS